MRHYIAIGLLHVRAVGCVDSWVVLERRPGGSPTLQAHDLTNDGANCHRRSRPCLCLSLPDLSVRLSKCVASTNDGAYT